MRPLLAIQRLNSILRRRILIPAKRWLDLQHFTALLFVFFGITTLTNPSAPFVLIAQLPFFENIVPVLAMMFIFSAAFLIFNRVGEVGFRLALLPLYLSLGVLLWYRLSGRTDSWFGVLLVIVVIGFLWIARVEVAPPKGGSDDHRRGI